MVDARGALGEGQEAVRAIADAAEANAAALLVLLSRTDAAALEAFHQHGATHFLVSPFTEAQLLHAFQFARRHAERVGGDLRTQPARRRGGRLRLVALAAGLAHRRALARRSRARPGLGEEEGRRISLMELFRKLDPEGRRAARDAIDRLLATGEATAFAHGEGGGPASPTMSAAARATWSAGPSRSQAGRRRAATR